MTFAVDTAWLAAVLLCSLRLGALLMLSPLLQALALPRRLRVLLVLGLALGLVGSLPHGAARAVPPDLPGLAGAALNELVVGATLAFGVFAAFGAFSFAGSLLDLQAGFNIANLFDPVTHSQAPLLATVLSMTGVALFFGLDAHLALLRGVAWSFERVPLGATGFRPDPAELLRQFGAVFTLGLTLAAPVLGCLFLVEVALAVLSRNLPQMNVFVLGAPLKIVTCLALLALLAPRLGPVARRVFDGIFRFWEAVL
ncbi:MAG: flagellar biosynthetic protein FliR [Telluria sp.]